MDSYKYIGLLISSWSHHIDSICSNTAVSCKYAPPFATLALVQKWRGAYKQDASISLTITPSLPVKHDLIVGGGWGRSARQKDAPDTSGRLELQR